jgi:nucleotide-binding universal stress UspA family protein
MDGNQLQEPAPATPSTDDLLLSSKEDFDNRGRHSRQASIQFGSRPTTPVPENTTSKPPKRASSPPPPSAYDYRVAFDTFDNKDAADYIFTLKSNHKAYAYTKNSRVFLCGIDENDYSEYALDWLLDELVDDGDQVVCLRVVDKKSKLNSERSLEKQKYRKEARKTMERIQVKAREANRSVSLVLEFAVGEVQQTIQSMIAVYEPASLVVGTKGRSLDGFQGLLPGSISKYCLQNSPVPVIVVRPSAKREKKKRRRLKDPNRKGYVNMVEKGGGKPMLNRIETNMRVDASDPEAGEKEALAVARAIGLSSMEATLRASLMADTGRAGRSLYADAEDDEDDEDDSSEEEEATSLDAILSQSLKKDPKPG